MFGGSPRGHMSATSSKAAQATAALAKKKTDVEALEEANTIKTTFAQ